MPRLRALRLAPLLLPVLLAACATPPGPLVGPPNPERMRAQAYLAESGDTFVADPARPLVWLGVVSQELPYDEAVWYCRRLPPHDGADWRVPTVEELKGAPFGRYHLPEQPVRLWSSSTVPGVLYRRWVVDPRTGVRSVQEVRQEVRLRVLCVTGGRP